jgi:hypothetical protein
MKSTDEKMKWLNDFLTRNGVEPFWANSALVWVRRVMAGNIHWVTDMNHPKVTVDPVFKYVRKLTVQCLLHSTSGTAPGKIVYTFGAGKQGGHKVEIKAV